jgi:hypothetical protein
MGGHTRDSARRRTLEVSWSVLAPTSERSLMGEPPSPRSIGKDLRFQCLLALPLRTSITRNEQAP